jgi:hypothetical protein
MSTQKHGPQLSANTATRRSCDARACLMMLPEYDGLVNKALRKAMADPSFPVKQILALRRSAAVRLHRLQILLRDMATTGNGAHAEEIDTIFSEMQDDIDMMS